MKQIKMRRQARGGNRARQGKAIFQKRPIESFPIERDENGSFRKAPRKLVKERVLFGKVAHEELLDLKAAGVPPGDSHEKRISTGSAGEAGGFGVQKKPPGGISKREAHVAGKSGVTRAGKKFERDRLWFGEFWRGKPVSNGEVFAELI